MKNLAAQALALCHAIEEAGASPELTECSVIAADLREKLDRIPEKEADPAAPPFTTSGAEGGTENHPKPLQ